MSAVVAVQNESRAPSVIEDMAVHYGMDKRAFEQTLRRTIMPENTSNEQCAAFLLVAKQHKLNPFTKEIFAFPSRGGIQPVVSVDGWMKLINSHPDFDGMEFLDSIDEKGELTAITCRMFRKSRSHPVSVTEYMSECRRPTDTWKQWPARMLRHKATIQAARYAFGFAGIMEPDEVERMDDVAPHARHIPPSQLIGDDRLQRHNDALDQYGEHVSAIKEAIAKEDYYTAAECWRELPSVAQIDLFLAPSKGGCFTTHERDVLKTKLPRDVDSNHSSE